jgi:UDP-N-acetylglucosamine 2-epimerase (non-hydrolysing)
MKTAIIMGTRPEIIKLSPIIKKLNKKNNSIIFTGQHYDYNLSLQFIEELGIRKPDYWLELTKSNPSTQIGEMIIKLAKILPKLNLDSVIVQGDTNTVLAASIASLKLGISISHVEAGPRSFDWRMPEEHNRIQVDHISDLLFAPSQHARKNLISENVHGKIFVTGNTAIDAIDLYYNMASKRSHFSIDVKNYILMTLHRSENVDDKKTLSSIMKAILDSHQNIIFPVHPRTIERLHRFGLYDKIKNSKNVLLIKPVGYFDMLELMKKCLFIITDSGGIQQEATSPKMRKKVLVTRKTTDSPEAVIAGVAKVVGVETSKILSEIQKTVEDPKVHTKNTPYGKGDAAKQIVKIMRQYY